MSYVSGQVIFRESGHDHHQLDGRSLMMFVGIIAVPKVCMYKTEHQYVMVGSPEGKELTIHPQGIDRTEQTRGEGLGHLVMHPFWRF